jgi:hypothetical protein
VEIENREVVIKPRYTPRQLKMNRIFLGIVFSVFLFFMLKIPFDDHLSLIQTLGFYGIFFGAALLALSPFVVTLRARKDRVVERAEWAKSKGIKYIGEPDKALASEITLGSVIASGGDVGWSYDSLLSGSRNHYSFRAVDYGYWVSGPRGGGSMIQTVVCIDLQKTNSNTEPFSLIAPELLEHCMKARKIRLDQHTVNTLVKNRILAVDRDRSKDPHISYEFLSVFRHMQDANVEYLGDRLLVYGIHKKLVGEEYLEWVDSAISLAGQL